MGSEDRMEKYVASALILILFSVVAAPKILDFDGDGVKKLLGSPADCDDTDPKIYPGAVEKPLNGVDEDCDGKDNLEGYNVIIVSVESLRQDHLGYNGYYRNTTPFIDSLADKAVVFKNHYSVRGQTWPSLTSFLTGLYPRKTGVRWQEEAFNYTAIPTIASIMRNNGYVAGAYLATYCDALKYHFDYGYCKWRDDENSSSRLLKFLEVNQNKKFFAFAHFYAPHYPYSPPKSTRIFNDKNYGGKYTGVNEDLVEIGSEGKKIGVKDLENIVANYDGEILYIDGLVEKIYSKLGNLGILNKTIFIFTSDHGENLYERYYYIGHACSIHEQTLHIPLLIKFPEGVGEAKKITRITENIDVIPTIIGLVGAETSAEMDGEVLTPLITGKGEMQGREYSLSELGPNIVSIRTPEKRYTHNPKKIGVEKIYGGCLPKGAHYRYPDEYYDIVDDPEESINLAKSKKIPETERLLLDAYLSPTDSVQSIKASEETLRHLRELGYMV